MRHALPIVLLLAAAAALAGGLVLMPRSQVLETMLPFSGAQVLEASGLGLDEVRISGQRFTADSAIFDSLDMANVSTLIGFDGAKAARRIEQLPWIATATITRVFPGRVDVFVTERKPFAVWMSGPSQAKLVDQQGRVLQAVAITQLPQLPKIAGEGAPEAAPALFEMLGRVPEIGGRLEMATRVAGRRWALDLTGGIRLELPPQGEEGVLADFIGDARGRQLLAKANSVIDLRSRREIAVRPREASSHEP